MADLDTAAKRFAGLMNDAALVRSSGLVMPDGTIDAADRQTLVGLYLPGGSGPSPSGANQGVVYATGHIGSSGNIIKALQGGIG